MNKFLLKIISYSSLFFICNISLYFISKKMVKDNYSKSYIGIITKKLDNISKNKSRRIILMGGSNVSTSVDSYLIEKELKIETINSATVFNTGYEYKLNFLKKYAKNGDIVVFIPEFKYYSASGKYGVGFLYKCFLFDYRAGFLFGYENWKRYLKKSVKTNIDPIRKILLNSKTQKHNLTKVFNEKGDYVIHLDSKSELEKVRSFPIVNSLNTSEEFLSDLKQAHTYFKNKNIRFYVMFPAYSKNFITNNLIVETKKLENKYSFFIGNIESILYEDNMFYDSPYHILREGRYLRTKELIIDLKIELNVI